MMNEARTKLVRVFTLLLFSALTHLGGTALEVFCAAVSFSSPSETALNGRGLNNCRANPDDRYDRQKLLVMFADLLHDARPEHLKTGQKHLIKNERVVGFTVWDLTDTTNKDLGQMEEPCVDFIDGHVYHFVDDTLPFSFSHIAVLENGEVKVFRSLNCPEGKPEFESLIQYLRSKPRFNKDGLLQKVANFGRYQYLAPTDTRYFYCRESPPSRPNPDKGYSRGYVYSQMETSLYRSAPEAYRRTLGISVVNQTQADPRALNFFIYDLTDPSNRQTTSREQVDFIEGHIYHFSYLDAPYSYSHIGVLEKGELKVFSRINCGKDKLDEVIGYVKNKSDGSRESKDVLKRLKSYRKYGVYLSYEGETTVQCNGKDVH